MNMLRRYLPRWMLVLAALIALWQSYRAHRSVREMHPPDEVPLPEPAPRVSIILPVRNEEANIDTCVASLLAQDYPDFDLTIIDDGSTDATPQLLAAWQARDERVHVHRVDRLPCGWAGKAHALHTGIEITCGEWLLFTDADTWHAPRTLRLMLGHALQQQNDLLSMHTNVMTIAGPAMPLLMPITEVLLAQRMTPSEMSDPASPHAFAFGQYILLRRAAYLATGGYAAVDMRGTSIDDLALAEQFKRQKQRVEVVNGRGLIRKSPVGDLAERPSRLEEKLLRCDYSRPHAVSGFAGSARLLCLRIGAACRTFTRPAHRKGTPLLSLVGGNHGAGADRCQALLRSRLRPGPALVADRSCRLARLWRTGARHHAPPSDRTPRQLERTPVTQTGGPALQLPPRPSPALPPGS